MRYRKLSHFTKGQVQPFGAAAHSVSDNKIEDVKTTIFGPLLKMGCSYNINREVFKDILGW